LSRPPRKRTGCLLFVDVDRFKVFNDTRATVWHAVLRAVADRLVELRASTPCRFSGDEFVVVCEKLLAAPKRSRFGPHADLFNAPFDIDEEVHVTRDRITQAKRRERHKLLRDADLAITAPRSRRARYRFDDTLRPKRAASTESGLLAPSTSTNCAPSSPSGR